MLSAHYSLNVRLLRAQPTKYCYSSKLGMLVLKKSAILQNFRYPTHLRLQNYTYFCRIAVIFKNLLGQQ